MASFEKLKSDWNQTLSIDIKWELSYVHVVKGQYTKVKGHLRPSCKDKAENVKMTSLEKLEVQTWFIDNVNLHMFVQSKVHKSRSKVIWG